MPHRSSDFPEREEDIDFSDIYEKHHVDEVSCLDTIVAVYGAPIVDETKKDKLLKVLHKVFTKEAGDIKEGGMWMPMSPSSEDKEQSKGYLFIDFETAESAAKAVKVLHQYKLSKKDQLLVYKFTDIEKYSNYSDDFKAPEPTVYEEKGYLKDWLLDDSGRDQFAVCSSGKFGMAVNILWSERLGPPKEVAMEKRENWTDSAIAWSPRGSYFATFHEIGIALWGGPEWAKQMRFIHLDVVDVIFSPREKYLITYSKEPIKLKELEQRGIKDHQFTEIDDDNKIVVWDIKTGKLLRSFPSNRCIFKWSPSDKYFARMDEEKSKSNVWQKLSIYETPGMGLIDQKSLRAEMCDFEWAPAKTSDGKELLAYWTPESDNSPARVTVLSVPSKKIVATKNIFNVENVKLNWQSGAKFLSAAVSGDVKSKMSAILIFHTREKDVPVENVSLSAKERILDLQWEPQGERFVVITEPSTKAIKINEVRSDKTVMRAYHLDPKGFSEVVIDDFVSQGTTHTHNHIAWSPLGRHFVTATLKRQHNNKFEVWDMDFESKMAKKKKAKAVLKSLRTVEHENLDTVSWDPSGYYVIAQSAAMCDIWDLFKDKKETLPEAMLQGQIRQALWRPRPSLLDEDARKEIRKNWKSYSEKYNLKEEDEMAVSTGLAAEKRDRKKSVEEWARWYNALLEKVTRERKALGRALQLQDTDEMEDIDEEIEEVVDEKIEII